MNPLRRPELASSKWSIRTKTLWLLRKFQRRFAKPTIRPAHGLRALANLPPEGQYTSLEEALNSRCTSDYDGNQRTSHWGLFDISRRLSDYDIQQIASYARIPASTSRRIGLRIEEHGIHFLADPSVSGIERNWLMIECGMHQQAVLLTGAALGIGCSLIGLERGERSSSAHDRAVMKVELGPMMPSYGDSFWTSSPPGREQAWKPGNLPTPVRYGKTSLLSALMAYEFRATIKRPACAWDLSQILWAARGRTPHYFNSLPWGMTIPTSEGKQDNSAIYLVHNGRVYSYLNWDKKNPTHSLISMEKSNYSAVQGLTPDGLSWNSFLIIKVKEELEKNYWEVGYQLLNILLQAHVLDIGYSAELLGGEQKELIQDKWGIRYAAVMVALKIDGALTFNSGSLR